MATIALPFSAVWTQFYAVWRKVMPARVSPETHEESREDIRHRQDFILDMVMEHPDAFAHELDVQAMMQMYPGRF